MQHTYNHTGAIQDKFQPTTTTPVLGPVPGWRAMAFRGIQNNQGYGFWRNWGIRRKCVHREDEWAPFSLCLLNILGSDHMGFKFLSSLQLSTSHQPLCLTEKCPPRVKFTPCECDALFCSLATWVGGGWACVSGPHDICYTPHHRLAFGFVCLCHIYAAAAGGGEGKVVCVYMCVCVLQQMSFVLKSAAGS